MEEKEILKKCFEDVVWMAIRYAHGRHTYAPGMVRDAVKQFQTIFPDWKPKEDIAIDKPVEPLSGIACPSDYLNDLFTSKD